MSLHRKLNERERMAYASVARLERERDDLHAQLAESDALLRNLRPAISMVLNALDRDAAEGKAARGEMAAELRAALSASAEPSAPVEIDERAELEAYCAKVGLPLDRLPSGDYLIPATRFVSQGWHAHAASVRKP